MYMSDASWLLFFTESSIWKSASCRSCIEMAWNPPNWHCQVSFERNEKMLQNWQDINFLLFIFLGRQPSTGIISCNLTSVKQNSKINQTILANHSRTLYIHHVKPKTFGHHICSYAASFFHLKPITARIFFIPPPNVLKLFQPTSVLCCVCVHMSNVGLAV